MNTKAQDTRPAPDLTIHDDERGPWRVMFTMVGVSAVYGTEWIDTPHEVEGFVRGAQAVPGMTVRGIERHEDVA